MVQLSEKQLQDSIFDFLIQSNFIVVRVNAGQARMQNPGGKVRWVRFVIWAVLGLAKSTKGIADILALSPKGKFYAFEVKIPGNKPSKEQLYFLARIRERHGVGEVVYTLDRVVELVNAELGNVLF